MGNIHEMMICRDTLKKINLFALVSQTRIFLPKTSRFTSGNNSNRLHKNQQTVI